MQTLRDYRRRFAVALAFADAWRPVGRLNSVKLAVWTSPFTGVLAILLFIYLLLRLLREKPCKRSGR